MCVRFSGLGIGLLSLMILACSGGPGGKSSPPGRAWPSTADFGGPGWSPSEVQVICNAKEGCPDQVGVLLFVYPERDGRIPFSKCTAFLSGTKEITSNGHCDKIPAGAEGYFISVSGGSREFRKITRTVFKQHTPGSRSDMESGRPDVAIFELNEPVQSFSPLRFSRPGDPVYDRVVGFVINNGPDSGRFLLESVACRIHRHESLFPYDLSENPDVITAFDCETRRGNSGGPVFAPGRAAVQGVLQGTSDMALKEKRWGTRLRDYERHNTVTFSNLRCFNAPAGSCIASNEGQTQSRFASSQMRAVEALRSRPPSSGAAGGIRYKAIPFQSVEPAALRFEVFYQPLCWEGSARPSTIPVPIESVEMNFDEWGEISSRIREAKAAQFVLSRSSGDRVEVRADWPAPMLDLSHPEQHPRRSWGRAFSIDLPQCAR